MRKLSLTSLTLILLCSIANAQPPGITMEMIMTTLPLEGAPLAEPGSYEVLSEGAYNSAGHVIFRPQNVNAFPAQDIMPIVIWGNGGCAIDGAGYAGFLTTIASHGFLVMTTTAIEGEEPRQQNDADLLAAIAWAEAENERAGSPLRGKIDTSQIAVMGQSCGGFLSVSLGGDARVDTIGVFNSGVDVANPNSPFASIDALSDLHGPVMFINGHEIDFMMELSYSNFELVNHVPTFYGARHNAGHTATAYHPGGGEFANVASNWVRYHFKGNAEAGRMFVGEDCGLCDNSNWETESKGL